MTRPEPGRGRAKLRPYTGEPPDEDLPASVPVAEAARVFGDDDLGDEDEPTSWLSATLASGDTADPGEDTAPDPVEILFGPLAAAYHPEDRHLAAWNLYQRQGQRITELEQRIAELEKLLADAQAAIVASPPRPPQPDRHSPGQQLRGWRG